MKRLTQTSFGEQIRSLRENTQLSLKEVSEGLKIDTSLLAKFERNERKPSKEIIKQLAKYYKVDNNILVKQCLSDQIAYQMLDENEGLDILKFAEDKVVYLTKARNNPIIENATIEKRRYEFDNIYNADCVKGMDMIENNTIDLTVTSPPYDNIRDYKGYHFDYEKIAEQLYRITKQGGIVVWVVGDKINNGNRSLTSFMQALYFQKIGFNVHDVMIYQKKNTPFMRSNAYTNCYEFMFVFSKGKPRVFNPLKTKTQRSGFEGLPFNKKADGINKKAIGELKKEKTLTNIWSYAVGLGGSTSDRIAFQHPAIFPEKLVTDHILSWTNEGDIVFDPMSGSGTTCKMAKLHGRKYLGIEISKEYCELANKRIKLTTPQAMLPFI